MNNFYRINRNGLNPIAFEISQLTWIYHLSQFLPLVLLITMLCYAMLFYSLLFYSCYSLLFLISILLLFSFYSHSLLCIRFSSFFFPLHSLFTFLFLFHRHPNSSIPCHSILASLVPVKRGEGKVNAMRRLLYDYEPKIFAWEVI